MQLQEHEALYFEAPTQNWYNVETIRGFAARDFDAVLIMTHAVAQLFEALRYKPEGRGFDSRWCHWNFSVT
jgi:hypothetical protein